MRIGIFLLAARFPGTSREQAIENALVHGTAAELFGFDDVFVAEHHFMPYGTCPSAVTFASLLAGRTERIGIGTAVSVLSTVSPVALGEQAALLSRLSGGRFTLGVGRGGPWVDLEVFGTGAERQSSAAFAEAVEVLTRWLSEPTVGHEGRFFRFRPVDVVPRPLGRVPVLVAATSAETVALAARHRLPMLLGMHATDEEKREMVGLYGEAVRGASGAAAMAGAAAESAAEEPDGAVETSADHVSVLVAQTAASREDGISLLRHTMPPWLRDGLAAHVRLDGATPAMRDPDAYAAFLAEIHAVGSPDDCVARIRASAAATGIDRVLLFVEGGGPRHTMRNIEVLGREVLPRLRP